MRTLAKDTKTKIGEDVELMGWIDIRRDHGKLIFFELRDYTGKVQLIVGQNDQELHGLAEKLRPEWAVSIKGKVAERPQAMKNPEHLTGNIEIKVSNIEVLSESKTIPFELSSSGLEIDEELRLKYRYLDLRRERLQRNLALRAKFVKAVRDFLAAKDFIEIETPLLTKSTPEGSRDFIVPSRLHPGKFYALPQSPQQYKQLLMVGGIERYFQVARALRDEDTRADRGLEHTQIDLEMSFVEQKDVMALVEEMIITSVENVAGKIMTKPFPVFSYKDAITKFGNDKFDLRDNKNSKELAFAWVIDFPVFVKNKDGKWTYSHNPFTAPIPGYKDLESAISLQYDLVCNGSEVGGGGIRIHDANTLIKVFEILGHKKSEIEEKFGHMLEAFRYGAPPHGGIALGLDRLIMLLAGESAIREVIAFPLTGDGRDPMMNSPSELTKEQLKELHIKLEKPKNKKRR